MAFLPGWGSALSVLSVNRVNDPANFPLLAARTPAPIDPWDQPVTERSVSASGASDQVSSDEESLEDAWQLRLPGAALSRPHVRRQRGYVLCRLEAGDPSKATVGLVAVDVQRGDMLWERDLALPVPALGPQQLLGDPVCDGQHIYCVLPADQQLWLYCVDLSGAWLWRQAVGPYPSTRTYFGAPVLAGSLVVLQVEPPPTARFRSYLAAVHRQTGELIWRVRRPAEEHDGLPLAARIAGRQQLVTAHPWRITSYDPQTGRELWTYDWVADRVASQLATDGQHVFVTSKTPRPRVLCLNASGQGDVTDTGVVWEQEQVGSDRHGPVVRGNAVYVLDEAGELACWNRADGHFLWSKRLPTSCPLPLRVQAGRLVIPLTDRPPMALALADGEVRPLPTVWEQATTATLLPERGWLLSTGELLRCTISPKHSALPVTSADDGKQRRF